MLLTHLGEFLLPALMMEYRRYRRVHGRWPTLHRPTHLSERIILRKLFEHNDLHTLCSDKFEVRDYVSSRIGNSYLVPLLCDTSRPKDLYNLKSWANTVIKSNHGSNMVQVVPAIEPSSPEEKRIIEKCEEWMQTDYSRFYNERHYRSIVPRILVEKFVGELGWPPAECKVHCFNDGRGAFTSMVQLISGRFRKKSMAFYLGGLNEHHRVRTIGDAPPSIAEFCSLIGEAIERSRVLSKEFNYVRVDWLMPQDSLYFSELTFTPGAGLSPTFGSDLDRELGSFWPPWKGNANSRLASGVRDAVGR